MNSRISFFLKSLLIGFLFLYIIPTIIHASSQFNKTGFKGLGVESVDFSPMLVLTVSFLILCYLIFWWLISGHIKSDVFIPLVGKEYKSKYFYTEIVLSLLTLVVIINEYYGNFESILLMRSREKVDVDFTLEFYRAFTLIFVLTNLRNFMFLKSAWKKLMSFVVLIFLLAALLGFGTRFLLVYPLISLFYYTERKSDLFYNYARKIIFILFAIIALIISSFRDVGIDGGLNEIQIQDSLLAFDQMNATFVIFSDMNNFRLGSVFDPIRMYLDFWLHLIPRSFLEMLGLEKNVHSHWLSWNNHLTGRVESNVTPGVIGQGYLEGGIIGLILFPVIWFLQLKLMLNLFHKIAARNSYRDIISILFIGGMLNSLRHFNVGFFFPAILCAISFSLVKNIRGVFKKLF